MGIEVQSVRLLLLARELGVDFSETLTIGRQRMMLSERQAAQAFARFRLPLADDDRQALGEVGDPFSDRLFRLLGAKQIDALDFSDYEGANILHDLNRPLPAGRGGKHSAVFDGGTIEHVFDVPTALASLMRLPRVNGHLILALPANNEAGHGFYQFSPELIFRALSEENGYTIEGVYMAPFFVARPWLQVRDPAQCGLRAGYSGWSQPTYVLAIARRVADIEPFAKAPQQSDYVADWANGDAMGGRRAASLPSAARRTIARLVPDQLLDRARQLRSAVARPDARVLIPFEPESLARANGPT